MTQDMNTALLVIRRSLQLRSHGLLKEKDPDTS